MMANAAKRSWKMQDFVAHGADVNCVGLGQKSGRVLVTGGDDKKVNLWAIGNPNCIMSLSGHMTPVECVKFCYAEDMVCAGSQAGILKLWDLEAAKLFRTLTGHKSGIKCVDFHPYGDFLASGSLDTSIKLWDNRNKVCIFTYKGHQQTVNSIKFSPDGQWIASGGEEGKVKIWDIRVGRVLKELNEHTGAVTDVEFHPQEFLLASCSADRSVNFWDLENFHLVSKTEKESSTIRCLQFSIDGECLFGGCAEQLKVYGWEPSRIYDTVTIGWGKVQHMAIAQSQLIGVSFYLTNVMICAVDMTKVSPIGVPASRISPFSHGQATRKSFTKPKPREGKPKLDVKIEEEYDTEHDIDSTSPVISNVNDYEAIFKPHRSLNHSPPPLTTAETTSDEEFHSTTPPLSTKSLDNPLESSFSTVKSAISELPSPIKVRKPRDSLPIKTTSSRIPSPNGIKKEFLSMPANEHKPVSNNESTNRPYQTSNLSNVKVNNILKPNNRETLRRVHSLKNDYVNQTVEPENLYSQRSSASRRSSATQVSDVPYEPQEELVPSSSDAPVDLQFEDFLPGNYRSGKSSQSAAQIPEAEMIQSLSRNHEMVVTILKIRQRNLQIVYSMWHNQDLKCALEGAVSMNDPSVLVDVLSAINKRPSLWNLDVCVVLLPAINNLLHSKYELYMMVGCDSLRLILKNFSNVIKSNVQWSTPTIGVDIPKEERYNKCKKCFESLVSIRTFLLKKQTMQGKLGQSFREIQSLLCSIEK